MSSITYEPIGIVHSPFETPEGTPIQPSAAAGVAGTVEVLPEYAEALRDLEGFSHIHLIVHFHLAKPPSLSVVPFLDDRPRGLFATRAPSRPNPIGLSVVRLIRIEGTVLHVEDLDVVDGTPVLDIKPFVPSFDHREGADSGWLARAESRLRGTRDDGRFSK